MTFFTLTTSNKSGSYYRGVSFRPLGKDTVEVRRTTRDTLMSSGEHGKPVVLPIAEARREYAELRRQGYKAMAQ